MESWTTPDARELCQGRRRRAEASLGQKGGRLFSVKLGLKISIHSRCSLSMASPIQHTKREDLSPALSIFWLPPPRPYPKADTAKRYPGRPLSRVAQPDHAG